MVVVVSVAMVVVPLLLSTVQDSHPVDPGPGLAALVGVPGPPAEGDVPGPLGPHDHLDLAQVVQDPPEEGEVGRHLPPRVQALLDLLGLHGGLCVEEDTREALKRSTKSST